MSILNVDKIQPIGGGSTITVDATNIGIAASITHIGDTDTAIRFPSDDTLTVETAGSERLRINSSGRVGIGTINPAEDLHIGSNSPYILLDDYDNARKWKLKGTAWFAIEDTTAGEDRLRITSAGLVGIGTNNPICKLVINSGTTDLATQIVSDDANVFLAFKDGDSTGNQQVQIGGIGNNFVAYAGGNERLRIKSDGKVLVGDGSAITQGRAFEVRGTGNQGILVGSTNNNGAQLLLDGIGGGDGSGGNYGALEVPTSGHLTIRNHDADKNIILGTGSASGANDTVVITDTQRVGVGTDNPDYLVTVAGISGTTKLNLKRTNASANGNAYGSIFYTTETGADVASIRAHRESANTNAYLAFSTKTTSGSLDERLRITSTGNVIPGSNNATNIGDGSTNFNSIWASTRFRGNDNVKIILGNSQNLSIRHDGSNNIIGSPVADDLHIKSGTGDNDNALIASFIHTGSKVGIKTTTADRDLEVFNSGSQTAIGIKGGTNTSQCSLWFMKPTDANIGGIYYEHGSTNTQGMYFRANDQQIADIKGTGILRVTNTIAGAGHTSAVHIFKASGNDADYAELAVGYDSDNCFTIGRKRNSADIQLNTRQSGSHIKHEYRGATRWVEYSQGMISTYPTGGANIIGRWRYDQANQSQNYEHHILGPDGQKLFPDYVDNNTHGIVWVAVAGTGTSNAYCQYRFSNKSSKNNLQLTHISGGSAANSNVPYIVNNNHNPAWKMDHSGGYEMIIDVMVLGGKGTNGTYSSDNIRGANP